MRAATAACAALAALALAAPAAPASSQIPIRVGQTLTGRLAQTDQAFSDGSRYKLYAFVGNKGDTVAVDLGSDDFDANLLVADASGNSLARNDDSGEKCNARLTFVPPATGNFRIYANSSAQAELGEYKLTLARGAARAAADTVCRGFGRVAGLIEVGRTVTGTLSSEDPEFPSDSTYFERWVLPVRANQAFTVDLQSDDFDAYLLLTRGRGEKIIENDDGGGGCNARLVYTAQDDHPLRVVVNTASRPRRQTGRFTLKVTEGESTTETKGNCRFTSGPTAAGGAGGAGGGGCRCRGDTSEHGREAGRSHSRGSRRRDRQRLADRRRFALPGRQLLQVLPVHGAGRSGDHDRPVVGRIRSGADRAR